MTVGQEDAPEDADLAQERATLPADSVAGRYALNDTVAGAARAPGQPPSMRGGAGPDAPPGHSVRLDQDI